MHHHPRRLFWGFKGAHPSLALSGTANMALLASSQMLEATEQLPAVLAMQGIYDEPAHTQFHLYRKLIRCAGRTTTHLL